MLTAVQVLKAPPLDSSAVLPNAAARSELIPFFSKTPPMLNSRQKCARVSPLTYFLLSTL